VRDPIRLPCAAVLRRKKDQPTAPAALPPEPEALANWVGALLGQASWSPIDVQPGDRIIEPPRSPNLPGMTARAGDLAVRYRALQLHAAGQSLTGAEARAVLARLGYSFRRADLDELRRLRSAAAVLTALARSGAPAEVGVAMARRADEAYATGNPPLAALSGVDVPPLSAGYSAAFGSAVERGLELRDALARNAPTLPWSP
jgi:hypothetical protein